MKRNGDRTTNQSILWLVVWAVTAVCTLSISQAGHALELFASSLDQLDEKVLNFRIQQSAASYRTMSLDQLANQQMLTSNSLQQASGKEVFTSNVNTLGLDSPVSLREALDIADQVHDQIGMKLQPQRMTTGFMLPVADACFSYQRQLNAPEPARQGLTNVEGAWQITEGTTDVRVAILDSGYLPHEDLDPERIQILPGSDRVDQAISGDGDGVDNDPTDPGDATACGKVSSWHGNHITGIIGATHNEKGIAGIDKNATLIPGRVLGIGRGGTDENARAGITWAGSVAQADIMNLSFGSKGSCLIGSAFYEVFAGMSNVLAVIAAGNNGADVGEISPASCPNANNITVGSSTPYGYRSQYSNFGTAIDIMAPGGTRGWGAYPGKTSEKLSSPSDSLGGYGVLSTVGREGYAELVGTSMSAPIVSGAAALMLAVDSTLEPEQVINILQATASPFADPTQQISPNQKIDGIACDTVTCGAGIVNVYAAVQHTEQLKQNIEEPQVFFHPRDLHIIEGATSVPIALKSTRRLESDVSVRLISGCGPGSEFQIPAGVLAFDTTIDMEELHQDCPTQQFQIDLTGDCLACTFSTSKSTATVFVHPQENEQKVVQDINRPHVVYIAANTSNTHEVEVTAETIGYYRVATSSDMNLDMTIKSKDNTIQIGTGDREILTGDSYALIAAIETFSIDITSKGENSQGLYTLSITRLPNFDDVDPLGSCPVSNITPVRACQPEVQLVTQTSAWGLWSLTFLLGLLAVRHRRRCTITRRSPDQGATLDTQYSKESI